MLTVRIVPCLDVKHGRVVKGIRFQGLTDQGDPADLAGAYEAQGADELVVLDVAATVEERKTQAETVRAVRSRLSVPLTVGGGIRSVEHASALLEAGADKVSVNTAAVHRPALLTELANRFGSQCVVIAIDAAASPNHPNGYGVVIRSGSEMTELDALDWAKSATEAGAGEILLTSFDRDGTRSGYELNLIGQVRQGVQVPIVASGGASTPEHMTDAIKAGADAVLAASIFHQGNWTVDGVKRELAAQGVPVRPSTTGNGSPS